MGCLTPSSDNLMSSGGTTEVRRQLLFLAPRRRCWERCAGPLIRACEGGAWSESKHEMLFGLNSLIGLLHRCGFEQVNDDRAVRLYLHKEPTVTARRSGTFVTRTRAASALAFTPSTGPQSSTRNYDNAVADLFKSAAPRYRTQRDRREGLRG